MLKSNTPPAQPLPQDALNALQELIKLSGSQAHAARRLGVNEGSISNALKGRYIGNVERLTERIRGELLNETVHCPGGYGQINRRICQDTREAPLWRFQNPYQRSLRLQCNQCVNNPKKKDI
jgi:hypothetical protein